MLRGAIARTGGRSLPSAALRCVRRHFAAGSPTVVTATDVLRNGEIKRYETVISSGRHTLRSDMTPESSGLDEGPSPKELLLASLASCTVMTIRIFTDSKFNSKAKGWEGGSLKRVYVEAEEFVAPGAHVPDRLEVRVALEGDLSAEQRRRIMSAAERCPVKRIIGGGLKGGITSALLESHRFS